MPTPPVLDVPPHLRAPGTAAAPFRPALSLTELTPGMLLRITYGDLDLLVAWTDAGVVAVEDRCPHMSAPLSTGRLDGCTLECPLHRGSFDVCDGEVVTFPTTGGLTPDGEYRPTWTPQGRKPKPALRPDDPKARARSLTRVRRLRFYPLRVREGMLEIALPA